MEPVDWLPEWLAYFLYLVWLDQTLIAGALAAIAAFFTIKYLRKQIDQSEIHRREELFRRHRMLRAGLPAALAELNVYAEQCGKVILDLRYGASATVADLPSLPSNALKNIQSVVETADEPAVTDLERILSFFQIQNSRLGTLRTVRKPPAYLTADRFRDALFLKASTNRLFNYARGKNSVPDEWDNVEWAKKQIASIALGGAAGALSPDPDLEKSLDRFWGGMIKSYGSGA